MKPIVEFVMVTGTYYCCSCDPCMVVLGASTYEKSEGKTIKVVLLLYLYEPMLMLAVCILSVRRSIVIL